MPLAFWELATLASWQVALQWSCTAICPTPDRELMCVALGVGVGRWKTWTLAPIFWSVRESVGKGSAYLSQCGDAAAVPGQLLY